MAAVETGDQKRKKEAMEELVATIAHGDDDGISASLKIALEVSHRNLIRTISTKIIPLSLEGLALFNYTNFAGRKDQKRGRD